MEKYAILSILISTPQFCSFFLIKITRTKLQTIALAIRIIYLWCFMEIIIKTMHVPNSKLGAFFFRLSLSNFRSLYWTVTGYLWRRKMMFYSSFIK